jgi:hypothetical protein
MTYTEYNASKTGLPAPAVTRHFESDFVFNRSLWPVARSVNGRPLVTVCTVRTACVNFLRNF